jgi:hypothetical protein
MAVAEHDRVWVVVSGGGGESSGSTQVAGRDGSQQMVEVETAVLSTHGSDHPRVCILGRSWVLQRS